MSLSEEERRAFVDSFLQELEDEHERRERLAQKRSHNRRERKSDQFAREQELAEIRNNMRRRFYEEKGYREDVDPTGRTVWLSPTEYDLRNKKRKRSRAPIKLSPRRTLQLREVVLFILMCLAAVIIGLVLVN